MLITALLKPKFIHSFKNFYGAPSRNLFRGAPSPTTVIQISVKQPAKHTFIIFRQEADFQGESIPGGGTNNGEWLRKFLIRKNDLQFSSKSGMALCFWIALHPVGVRGEQVSQDFSSLLYMVQYCTYWYALCTLTDTIQRA